MLDADIIIAGEKGGFDLQGWMESQRDERFEIAAITVAELWHGVERASPQHKKKRKEYMESVLKALPIIPYTEETGYEHARLWAKLEAAGKMIGYYDLIVAATALERGSSIATLNRKHFAQVRGLTLVEPR